MCIIHKEVCKLDFGKKIILKVEALFLIKN